MGPFVCIFGQTALHVKRTQTLSLKLGGADTV